MLMTVFLLFSGQVAQADTTPQITPPDVPANLKVPGGERPVLKVLAKGVQIYTCAASTTNAGGFEWTLKAPEAELFDEQGTKVGKHYAGPTWEATDGSKVVGAVKERADAPDGKGIPWLLLTAKENSGNGVLSKISSVQRVETVAGFAPNSADCTQAKKDSEVRVNYSASYYFYSPAGVDNQTPSGVPASGQGGTINPVNSGDFSIAIIFGFIITIGLARWLISTISHKASLKK